MSRETLLDEAIVRAKEEEDWQLVEWLRMARGSESAARWYSEKLREAHRTERKLLNENAKLRELVQKMMRFFEDGDWCDTCEVAKECDAQEQYEEDCLMRGIFRGCMRELGVEV